MTDETKRVILTRRSRSSVQVLAAAFDDSTPSSTGGAPERSARRRNDAIPRAPNAVRVRIDQRRTEIPNGGPHTRHADHDARDERREREQEREHAKRDHQLNLPLAHRAASVGFRLMSMIRSRSV